MVLISIFFNATTGISVRFPLWVMGDYDVDSDVDYVEGRELVERLMLLLMVLMMVLTIPPILLFKSNPPTAPSFSASEQCQRENYVTAGKTLVRNKDYLLLSCCFPFILGSVTLFTLQMEYIIKPFGYTLSDISNAVGLGVLAGLLGDICVGLAIKKTQSYK